MTTQEILKQVRKIEIKTRGLVNQVFSGEYHSVFKGRGMEFAEVREYQFGDDIRNIDWNVTARFGHPYVKIFEEERELTVMLVVDLSGSLSFGSATKTKQQIAAELSAILAFSALKNNDKTGLLLFTDKVEKFIPPRKGQKHALRIIREVLSFQPEGKRTNIKSALEFLNNAVKRRSIIFVMSDFIDSGYENIISSLSKKHDLAAIVLTDKREYEVPPLGLIKLKDSETGETRWFNTSNAHSVFLLKNLFKKSIEMKEKVFKSAKIDSIVLSTEQDYVKPLVKFFKAREKR
ncbi:MAG: DUF58 domain-containing protein [Bacteroidota bacterium]|nr:DUF58 domain-containing protein [Bacteroidota bacterium]